MTRVCVIPVLGGLRQETRELRVGPGYTARDPVWDTNKHAHSEALSEVSGVQSASSWTGSNWSIICLWSLCRPALLLGETIPQRRAQTSKGHIPEIMNVFTAGIKVGCDAFSQLFWEQNTLVLHKPNWGLLVRIKLKVKVWWVGSFEQSSVVGKEMCLVSLTCQSLY